MADISITSPGCHPCCNDNCGGCDDCDCHDDREGHEKGKRGRRGHRGHRGHRGPEGPPGPSGLGLLKFSGLATGTSEGPAVVSFLPDSGTSGATLTALSYPIAVKRRLQNLATNVIGFVVPAGESILIELLLNGAVVPGFTTLYGPGEGGIKSVTAGPVSVVPGDTLDLRVTNDTASSVSISATIGVA